jgi:hypothetical protein
MARICVGVVPANRAHAAQSSGRLFSIQQWHKSRMYTPAAAGVMAAWALEVRKSFG